VLPLCEFAPRAPVFSDAAGSVAGVCWLALGSTTGALFCCWVEPDPVFGALLGLSAALDCSDGLFATPSFGKDEDELDALELDGALEVEGALELEGELELDEALELDGVPELELF